MTTFPPKNNPQPYSKVRSQLATGDLFFLHGTSDAGMLIEDLEQAEGWPPYSHVGMVIVDAGNLYFWDAPGGGDCFPDPYASDPDNRIKITGQPAAHNGCRVAVLDDVLAYYSTKVDTDGFWLRQLSPAVTPDRFGALRRFINRVDGLPFPAGPFKDPSVGEVTGLGANYLAGQKGGSVLYGTYFCAHLVADSYMHMGLLAMEGYPPNGYSPAAFGMNIAARLPLVPPAALADVQYVIWDGPKHQDSGYPCPQTAATPQGQT